MNPEQRPTAVVVLAVFNFIVGGISVVGGVCLGLWQLLQGQLAKLIPFPPGQPNPLAEIATLPDAIPGYYVYLIIEMVTSLALGVLLIVAGVGLLRMKPQGRSRSLLYAAIKIVLVVISFIYTVVYVQPATEAWTKDLMARMAKQQGAGAPVVGVPTLGTAGNLVAAAMSSLINLVYPIVLLVLLNTSTIKAAFSGGPARAPWDEGPEDDQPDVGSEDHERPRPRSRAARDERDERADRDDRTEIMPDPPRPRPLPPPESREDPQR